MKTQIASHIPALRFHWLTGWYDWLVGRFMPERAVKMALIQQADVPINGSVLDFGVGTATLSMMIKQIRPDVAVTGLDVDAKILALAGEKIKQASVEVSLKQYDGIEWPFDDRIFDRVLTSLVLHHLTRSQRLVALSRMHRVLRLNGELHIADWGKPANVLQRGLFFLVQLLDGFETTRDSVRGDLPDLLWKAGFNEMTETKHFQTIFGTLRLWRAVK